MSDLIITILLLLIIIVHACTDTTMCEQGGITECCTPNENESGQNCHVYDYTNKEYCSCSKTCVDGDDVDSYIWCPVLSRCGVHYPYLL